MKTSTKCAIQGLSLTIALILCLGSVALAGPPTANVVPVGQNYYVSLHKYATPTDIEDVYKVQLTVSGNVRPEPIYITFVLDGSPSMSHIALRDTPSTDLARYRSNSGWHTDSPSTDTVPRWEGLVAGYKSAIEIFSDPAQNPVYDQTYVSVVTFDYGGFTKIRTSADSSGLNYAKASPSTVDFSSTLPAFSNLHFPISHSFQYKHPNTSSATVSTTSGFVNVSTDKQALLHCLPEYPYLDQAMGTTIGWLPFDSSGTNTGSGMDLAYQLMSATYGSSGTDNVNARRYVIFLGDGDDNHEAFSVAAHKYAAALKSPHFKADGSSPFYLNNDTTLRGLNTEIWSIGLGLSNVSNCHYNTAYPNTYYPLATTPQWSSEIISWINLIANGSPINSTGAWTNSYIEPHLISLGNILKDPYEYENYPTTAATMDTVFSFYNNRIKNDSNDVNGYNVYEYTEFAYPSVGGLDQGAQGVFTKYAKRIVGENITVTDIIGRQFSLYQYPGEPLLKTSGTGAGTASSAGRSISWAISEIPIDGSTLSLTYYLKIDSATADPNLWYPTNEEAYIQYDRKGLLALGENPGATYHTVVYFPVPLVNVTGQSKVEDPSPSPDPSEPDSPISNAIIMQPNFVARYGTPLQPYTPSVTRTPIPARTPVPEIEIIEETLEDDAVERKVDDEQRDWDWGGEMPVPETGSFPMVAIVMLAASASVALVVIRRKKGDRS